MDVDILRLLYEDCESFCGRVGYNYSKEYKDAVEKSAKLEESLYSHFTEEVKALYEEVRLSQLEKDGIEDLHRFKKAFAFGALFMLDVVNEKI